MFFFNKEFKTEILSTPDARLHKVWSDQRADVDLRPGGFLLWLHHEALLHAPEVLRQFLTCYAPLCLIAPFLVLEVDVELGEGGQLSMVSSSNNLDWAGGDRADNCWTI